jgi:hypothetical protein
MPPLLILFVNLITVEQKSGVDAEETMINLITRPAKFFIKRRLWASLTSEYADDLDSYPTY